MNQEERLYFCKQCDNRSFNPKKGVICSLTDERADFEENCNDYKHDDTVNTQNFLRSHYSVREVPHLPENIRTQIYKEQNFSLAVTFGITASILGAMAWAAVTVITGVNASITAVAIGMLISFTIKFTGKGVENKYGILGAGLTLLSILFGYFFTVIYILAEEYSVGFFDVITSLGFWEIWSIVLQNVGILTIVFIAIGIAEGYKFAFRVIPHDKIEKLEKKANSKAFDLIDN